MQLPSSPLAAGTSHLPPPTHDKVPLHKARSYRTYSHKGIQVDTYTPTAAPKIPAARTPVAPRPRQTPSLREKFCHTVSTAGGWIGGLAYALSLTWLPMMVAGLAVGSLNFVANKLFSLNQEYPFMDGVVVTTLAIPSLVGGAIGFAGWTISSPIALGLECADKHHSAKHDHPNIKESLVHNVLQAAYTSSISWMELLSETRSSNGFAGLPKDVEDIR